MTGIMVIVLGGLTCCERCAWAFDIRVDVGVALLGYWPLVGTLGSLCLVNWPLSRAATVLLRQGSMKEFVRPHVRPHVMADD